MWVSKDFLCETLGDASVYVGRQACVEGDISFSIDSRSKQENQLFVALSGNRVDGHDFIDQAIGNGAWGLLISKRAVLEALSERVKERLVIIIAADTQQAMIALAKAWRAQLTIPLVGITGSVGKTSTKEMLRSMLRHAGVPAAVSYGNQNTLLGIALNLSHVQREHKVAVFEVGINDKGEIESQIDLLRPTIGVITFIAHAHALGLGSLHDIAYEKKKMFRYFSPTNIGIICGDQDLLADASYPHPVAKFGFKTKNQVQARKVRVVTGADGVLATQFVLKWYGAKVTVTMPGNHLGMVNNALAASTVAYFLEIPLDAVVNGIEQYEGFAHRFEIKDIRGKRGRVISDCYNANPESMKAALVAFDQMPTAGAKIAVIGNMLELGEKQVYWHRQIGRLVNRLSSIQTVILVGELAWQAGHSLARGVQATQVADWQEATTVLKTMLGEHDQSLVLVKASRGVNLTKMVEQIVE
ncbi:UDP-N-acetylmuramoyl-tripeptide--D-alanyl-D-alanine ligase [Candidatus Babeliales bacterium]|nr:UDP-N-acetylmuramoyl-tripeptide--D-alanyl-D-alanine ligase [Candidatus Babeliales bacterium]